MGQCLNTCIFLLAGLATGMAQQGVAWSQSGATADPAHIAAERQRIENERAQGNALFNAQEQACQSSVTVTSCLHDVGARRIAMLSNLKRQETRLNDAERAQRAVEQTQRTQEKATERMRNAADAPATPDTAFSEKQQTQREKQEAHRKLEGASPADGSPSQRQPKSAPDESMQEKSRSDYARKQEETNKRRLERDKRLRDTPAGRSALPVP